MKTQSKKRLFGMLLVLGLVVCIFLTLTPIAFAQEPPVAQLYNDNEVQRDEQVNPQTNQIEQPQPELYNENVVPRDEQANPQTNQIEQSQPELYNENIAPRDEQANPQTNQIGQSQPELITEQERIANRPLSLWSWILIIGGGIIVLSLIIGSMVNRRRNKSTY